MIIQSCLRCSQGGQTAPSSGARKGGWADGLARGDHITFAPVLTSDRSTQSSSNRMIVPAGCCASSSRQTTLNRALKWGTLDFVVNTPIFRSPYSSSGDRFPVAITTMLGRRVVSLDCLIPNWKVPSHISSSVIHLSPEN